MPADSVPPPIGVAHDVAPGVRWLRSPLPYALDHVNVWLLDDDQKTLVVDTGIDDTNTRAMWDRLLDEGGALAAARRIELLATHLHPDHVGMAGALQYRLGAPLLMTRGEHTAVMRTVAHARRQSPNAAHVAFLKRAGWSDHAIVAPSFLDEGFARHVSPLPRRFVRLQDGDRITAASTTWEVVTGGGHSPEHACLYSAERRLFISGDQVLERISSNVSVMFDDPDADPMHAWLSSIAKIRARVSDDVLVLPAHHSPFRGLHARLDALERGQREALDRLRAALAKPLRVVDAIEPLFRRPIFEGVQFELATGECIACLNHLIHRGEAVRSDDTEGTSWYQLGDASFEHW